MKIFNEIALFLTSLPHNLDDLQVLSPADQTQVVVVTLLHLALQESC